MTGGTSLGSRRVDLSLTGRVAIVTGGGRGIGRVIALTLAAHEAAVVVVDRLSDNAAAVAAEIEAVGGRALALTADVTDHALARRLAGEIEARFGRIDVLVNNAGVTQPKPFPELTESDWDRTVDVHLKGAFNWSQAVLPALRRAGQGRIVNISSMSAKQGAAQPAVSKTAYAAAKAGMLGLTRGLAREAAPAVTVNAICPGLIRTEMTSGLTSGDALARANALIPAGRPGEPEDVAAAVVFLVSDAAGYITGEIVDVNGGIYID